MRNPRECRKLYSSQRNHELAGTGRNAHLAGRYRKYSVGYIGLLAIALLCGCNDPTASKVAIPHQVGVSSTVATADQTSACTARDGSWRCSSLKKPTILATSGGSSPIVPASWTVPDWYIDPQNVSTCASDSNTGTSATCSAGSIGPLLTWSQLQVVRLGLFGQTCATFSNNVNFHFVSSDLASNRDLVSLCVYMKNGAAVVIRADSFGTLLATSTLTSFVARVAATNTPWSYNVASGTSILYGSLMVNTTQANTLSWPQATPTSATPVAGPWNASPPMVQLTLPTGGSGVGHPSVRNNWANGNAVQLYQPISIAIGNIHATVIDNNTPPLVLYHMNLGAGIGTPSGGYPAHVGGDLDILECGAAGDVADYVWDASPAAHLQAGLFNTEMYDLYMPGSGLAGNSTINQFRLYGGTLVTGNLFGGVSSVIDGDSYLSASINLVGPWTVGSVYLASGTVLSLYGSDTIANQDYGVGHIYGPGVLNTVGRLSNTTGSTFTTVLPVSSGGGLQINSQTVACNGGPANLTTACNLAITNTNLDAAFGVLGFGGNAQVPGGGAISNFGP